MRHFTPRQLKDHLDCNGDRGDCATEKPLLLDVRESWEYAHCHIEGSELIPMGQIPQNVEALDAQRETIVICHHGIRSRQVAHYMEQSGFTDVINLEGGVERWALEVEPTMKRY